MNERGANIDIVFRNGLKDMEVLPPPEIWVNVHPVIIRKQRSFMLARVAAIGTIVIAISIIANSWSSKVIEDISSDAIAFNDESANIDNTPVLARPLIITETGNDLIGDSQSEIIESSQEVVETPTDERRSSPAFAILPETNTFSMNNPDHLNGQQLAALNSSVDNSFEINKITETYIPVDDNVKNTERWTIAALASPTYYSRINTGNDEVMQQLIASEQSLISYSGGVTFAYKINQRFSVQSGLFYSSVGQEVGGISSFGGFEKYGLSKGDRNFEVQTSNGTVYTNNADVFLISNGPVERVSTNYTSDIFDPEKASLQPINNNLQQNFSYLELPIMVRYKLVDKTLDFNIIGGLSYNMLVNNSVYTMVDGGKYFVGKTDGLNMITLSSSLGMAMEYNFSDNLSLNLEPTFRYYLNPFSQLSGSGIHPYSFGIFSGISYKF